MDCSEQELFFKLKDLCQEDGFIYAYAYLCVVNNFMPSTNDEDIKDWYSKERLNKNELKTLQGLMIQKEINVVKPSKEQILQQMLRANELLMKIHEKLSLDFSHLDSIFSSFQKSNSFAEVLLNNPNMLRECIFYCADSAYDFQYEELSKIKYQNDEEWLKNNKGFTISDAVKIVMAIKESVLNNLENSIDSDNILNVFKLNIDALINKTKLDKVTVINFVQNFTSIKHNKQFQSISDLNDASLMPIVYYNSDYYLFHTYVLLEALYESPMFWIRDEDKEYLKSAEKNRGQFVENITCNFLKKVFDKNCVYANVNIYRKDSKERIGEIDILVIFGHKALIFQAKSKALTLQARRGNIDVLQKDFANGVQNAYNQAVECAMALHSGDVILKDQDNNIIELNLKISRYYPITITSEHFPALVSQSLHFLKRNKEFEYLNEPFIMDIFFLDILTEFLNSPLYFISYIARRSNYFDKSIVQSEFTLLSYHLKKNLWISSEYNMLMLDEDVTIDLDKAILARRKGMQGKSTPDGILTKHVGTNFQEIISQIEFLNHPHAADLGLFLLEMSENCIDEFNKLIDYTCNLTIQDSKRHDFSLQLEDKRGFTIHSTHCRSQEELQNSIKVLESHVIMRKYIEKTNVWFGVLIDPHTKSVQAILKNEYEWVKDKNLENVIPTQIKKNKAKIELAELMHKAKTKVGRNDKCPCGSGKKYKKCCLN